MEQSSFMPPSRKRPSTEPVVCSDLKKPVTQRTEKNEIDSYNAENNLPKAGSSTGDCEVEESTQQLVETNMFDDIYNSVKEVLDRIQDQIENCVTP